MWGQGGWVWICVCVTVKKVHSVYMIRILSLHTVYQPPLKGVVKLRPVISQTDRVQSQLRRNTSGSPMYSRRPYPKKGSQRDVVFLGWPISPSYMSPHAGGGGAGYQPMCTAAHHNAHGAQINFGDLTIGSNAKFNLCPPPSPPPLVAIHILSPHIVCFSVTHFREFTG